MALVDERVVRSAQDQRRTLHAGEGVTHIQLSHRRQRYGGGVRSNRQTPVAREETSAVLVLTGERAPRLIRRAVAPMLNDRVNDRVALLNTLCPLVAGTADDARRRRDQHQRPDEARM